EGRENVNDEPRSGRPSTSWLDLSNAFGSIPHATTRKALLRSAVPQGLIAIWDSMYDGCTTRVRTAEGHTLRNFTPCALSLRYPLCRNTAEAQRCPAPPLESHSPSRGSAG
ncbi:hypothetical protein ALC57_13809, partial [Trachymyrmex cornetzi]